MKPEDSARLAREAVMGNTRGIREDAVAELRRIIDEQAAEIARLETQSENQARIIDTQRRLAQCGESKFEAENEVLKEQLAEERAKREATERIVSLWEDKEIRRAVCCNNNEERAETAERELAEERSRREQAETALSNGKTRVDCCCYEGAHKRWAERAVAAEKQVAELEAELVRRK